MTREEAIAQLKMNRDLCNFNPMTGEEEPMNEDCRKSAEAFDMAIKALEQQPCEDTISRQAALATMETWDKFGCDPDGKLVRYDDDKHYIPYVHYEDMVHAIKHLPSAQPEQRWIPCSERLPEEMGTYMTTIDYGEHGLATGQRYYYGSGLQWNDECVIAWMPLPTPYKERN